MDPYDWLRPGDTSSGAPYVPSPAEERLPGMSYEQQMAAHREWMRQNRAQTTGYTPSIVSQPGGGVGLPKTQNLQSSIGLFPGETDNSTRIPISPRDLAPLPPVSPPPGGGGGYVTPQPAAPTFGQQPYGAVPTGLREPFGPTGGSGPSASDFGFFDVTGFDRNWGPPPSPRGLRWNPGRAYYEPTGMSGDPRSDTFYADMASRGIYAQPYQDDTQPGVWQIRWVRPDPTRDAPYEILGAIEPLYGAARPDRPEPPGQQWGGNMVDGVIDMTGARVGEPIGLSPPPWQPQFTDFVWIPRNDLPRQCGAWPFEYLPVLHADYASGRWLEHDYEPSIPVPYPFNTVKFQCDHPPGEPGKKGKGGGQPFDPRERTPGGGGSTGGETRVPVDGLDVPYDPSSWPDPAADDVKGGGQIGIARDLLDKPPEPTEPPPEYDPDTQEAVDDDPAVKREKERIAKEQAKQAKLQNKLAQARSPGQRKDLQRQLDKSVAREKGAHSALGVAEARAAESFNKRRGRELTQQLAKLKYTHSTTWNPDKRKELEWAIQGTTTLIGTVRERQAAARAKREQREAKQRDNKRGPGPGPAEAGESPSNRQEDLSRAELYDLLEYLKGRLRDPSTTRDEARDLLDQLEDARRRLDGGGGAVTGPDTQALPAVAEHAGPGPGPETGIQLSPEPRGRPKPASPGPKILPDAPRPSKEVAEDLRRLRGIRDDIMKILDPLGTTGVATDDDAEKIEKLLKEADDILADDAVVAYLAEAKEWYAGRPTRYASYYHLVKRYIGSIENARGRVRIARKIGQVHEPGKRGMLPPIVRRSALGESFEKWRAAWKALQNARGIVVAGLGFATFDQLLLAIREGTLSRLTLTESRNDAQGDVTTAEKRLAEADRGDASADRVNKLRKELAEARLKLQSAAQALVYYDKYVDVRGQLQDTLDATAENLNSKIRGAKLYDPDVKSVFPRGEQDRAQYATIYPSNGLTEALVVRADGTLDYVSAVPGLEMEVDGGPGRYNPNRIAVFRGSDGTMYGFAVDTRAGKYPFGVDGHFVVYSPSVRWGPGSPAKPPIQQNPGSPWASQYSGLQVGKSQRPTRYKWEVIGQVGSMPLDGTWVPGGRQALRPL